MRQPQESSLTNRSRNEIGKVTLAAVVSYSDQRDQPAKQDEPCQADGRAERKANKLSQWFNSAASFRASKESRGCGKTGESAPAGRVGGQSESRAQQQQQQPQVVKEGEQVIEFRFDLIVEQKQSDELEEEIGGQDELAWQQDSRLAAELSDLVDSFVLESTDVCLLNVGGARRAANFEAILRLAKDSLLYAFELLGSRRDRETCIELSASLFCSDQRDQSHEETPTRVASIVDLLAASESQSNRCDTRSQSVECLDVEASLACLELIKIQLGKLKSRQIPAKFLFILGLKLKQNINGGIFGNRMCFIDFDAEICELHPIFESIFSGRALTHLKSRQNRFIYLNDNSHGFEKTDRILLKQSHLAASSDPREPSDILTRAELILYKQLSSALIRTLTIVHVHKFKRTNSEITDSEHALMQKNLLLLNFAQTIHRASQWRLRRCKRMYKIRLGSSNVSMASNQTETPTCLDHLATPSHSRRRQRRHRMERFDTQSGRRRTLRRAESPRDEWSLAALIRPQAEHSSCLNRPVDGKTRRPSDSSTCLLRSQRQSADIFTESSSISTSSGSQRAPTSVSKHNPTARVATRPLGLWSNLSDTDSVASTNLVSFSSSSPQNNTSQLPDRLMRDIELRTWISKATELTHNLGISKRANSALSRGQNSNYLGSPPDSIALMDCPNHIPLKSNDSVLEPPDNSSDICSVIAEPLKELKLEQFLSQFNDCFVPQGNRRASEIDPSLEMSVRTSASSKINGGLKLVGCHDDDEDCKSHSSILEHLSSLALETSTKAKQNQIESSLNDELACSQSFGLQFSSSRQLENEAKCSLTDGQRVKLVTDQTDCMSPIGMKLLEMSLDCQPQQNP